MGASDTLMGLVDQARLIASAAYTLARAANADLEISDDETAAIERELQAHDGLDEATAVLVTEMAKLQARTVGGILAPEPRTKDRQKLSGTGQANVLVGGDR